MDFLLTSLLMFGIGILVGRLFWRLNPFFMLFGIILGGAMFVQAVQRNSFYSFFIILGFAYGLYLMKLRSRDASNIVEADSSPFERVFDFFYTGYLRREAGAFGRRREREERAYDEYRAYSDHVHQKSQKAQEEAQGRTDQARQQSESAQQKQEDINKQWHQFQKEKQKFEQEKTKDEFIDTRTNYEILGVSETASLQEITKAYRKLRSKLHEDKNLNRTAAFIKEAERELIKARHAYEALTGKKAKR